MRIGRYAVILSSMRARVILARLQGEFVPAHAQTNAAVGDLHLTYRNSRNRRVAVLQLIAVEKKWPNLYDPKLVELSANTLRFVGGERTGNAWCVQEWICELM